MVSWVSMATLASSCAVTTRGRRRRSSVGNHGVMTQPFDPINPSVGSSIAAWHEFLAGKRMKQFLNAQRPRGLPSDPEQWQRPLRTACRLWRELEKEGYLNNNNGERDGHLDDELHDVDDEDEDKGVDPEIQVLITTAIVPALAFLIKGVYYATVVYNSNSGHAAGATTTSDGTMGVGSFTREGRKALLEEACTQNLLHACSHVPCPLRFVQSVLLWIPGGVHEALHQTLFNGQTPLHMACTIPRNTGNNNHHHHSHHHHGNAVLDRKVLENLRWTTTLAFRVRPHHHLHQHHQHHHQPHQPQQQRLRRRQTLSTAAASLSNTTMTAPTGAAASAAVAPTTGATTLPPPQRAYNPLLPSSSPVYKDDWIRLYAQSCPSVATVPNEDGWYPLHLACQAGYTWNQGLRELVGAAPHMVGVSSGPSVRLPLILCALRHAPKTPSLTATSSPIVSSSSSSLRVPRRRSFPCRSWQPQQPAQEPQQQQEDPQQQQQQQDPPQEEEQEQERRSSLSFPHIHLYGSFHQSLTHIYRMENERRKEVEIVETLYQLLQCDPTVVRDFQ